MSPTRHPNANEVQGCRCGVISASSTGASENHRQRRQPNARLVIEPPTNIAGLAHQKRRLKLLMLNSVPHVHQCYCNTRRRPQRPLIRLSIGTIVQLKRPSNGLTNARTRHYEHGMAWLREKRRGQRQDYRGAAAETAGSIATITARQRRPKAQQRHDCREAATSCSPQKAQSTA